MDFEKLCMMFTVKEPFYGIFLSSMVKRPDKSCPTLGVGLSGKLFELVYNPAFVSSVTEDELMELLKHETLHVAFNTFSIFEDMEQTPEYKYWQNVASDMEINCYLDSSALARLEPALPSIYGWEERLGSRKYYRMLLEKRMEQHNENSESEDRPELQTLDTHEYWPTEETASRESLDMVRDMTEELLLFAADEVEKGRGEVPGCLKIRVEELRNMKKARPVADWKQYVRRYLGKEFSESCKRSHKKPSKRFEDAPGKRRLRKANFLVAVDTSGSVSVPEYLEFFRQLRTISSTASFHVVECDSKIQYEYDYTRQPNLTLHGHGGTNFQPVIDRFIAERKNYDALIYFTDGECSIPANTPPETLWVISSKGDHNLKKYRVNGASAVFIPEEKKGNK